MNFEKSLLLPIFNKVLNIFAAYIREAGLGNFPHKPAKWLLISISQCVYQFFQVTSDVFYLLFIGILQEMYHGKM
jgi:hypothetical protein